MVLSYPSSKRSSKTQILINFNLLIINVKWLQIKIHAILIQVSLSCISGLSFHHQLLTLHTILYIIAKCHHSSFYKYFTLSCFYAFAYVNSSNINNFFELIFDKKNNPIDLIDFCKFILDAAFYNQQLFIEFLLSRSHWVWYCKQEQKLVLCPLGPEFRNCFIRQISFFSNLKVLLLCG